MTPDQLRAAIAADCPHRLADYDRHLDAFKVRGWQPGPAFIQLWREEHAASQAGVDAELEASQRRAVRIQQLLDEQRDRSRKDAAASRESERQLQQQIDRQAKEIDRLRDELADLHAGEEEPAGAYANLSPAEWLWTWTHATAAERLERAAQIIDAGMRAGTCFRMAHEKTIQRLRAELGRPAEQSLFRPEHEDGTPYRYNEMAAEGWDYCDGCRTWIRGHTADEPHVCGSPIHAIAVDAPDA
ncbi:hypothetical protein ABZY44_21930 [Streptomyces sp. NPDC006544]|uniref:hypothetical protein n=1 Tax=Streptomyces sp. NPDC006544 TaxID=3154583 RepID=UPI0033AD09C0